MSKIELGTKTMVTCSQLINDYYRLPFNFSNNHQKRRLIWYLRFYLWQLNHSRVSFDEAGDPRWNCTCWMFTMIERRYYIILRCYYFTRRHQISVSISSSATTRNNGRLIFVVVFRWFGEEYTANANIFEYNTPHASTSHTFYFLQFRTLTQLHRAPLNTDDVDFLSDIFFTFISAKTFPGLCLWITPRSLLNTPGSTISHSFLMDREIYSQHNFFDFFCFTYSLFFLTPNRSLFLQTWNSHFEYIIYINFSWWCKKLSNIINRKQTASPNTFLWFDSRLLGEQNT